MRQSLDFVRRPGGALLAASGSAPFAPTEVSAVSAWLRLQGATTVSGDYSSVPDMLTTNPATQGTAALRPTAGTSTNGLPTALFVASEPNTLNWPKASNNNGTQQWGIACWVKMTAYAGAGRYIFDSGGLTARYDNMRITLFYNASRNLAVEYFGQDTVGYNGRLGVAAAAGAVAGTWFWVRVQFDGTQGTEAGRLKLFVNEVSQSLTFSNVGAGGTPVLLRTNAESIAGVIGAFDNADTTLSMDGTIGPNIFVFNASPTAAQAAALMNFEAPT